VNLLVKYKRSDSRKDIVAEFYDKDNDQFLGRLLFPVKTWDSFMSDSSRGTVTTDFENTDSAV